MTKSRIHTTTMTSRQSLPLVSVIMPVHNTEKFLAEAIQSIVDQTYSNLELLVVDDASTDNSLKIAKQFAKKYPQIVKSYRTPKQTNSAGNGATNYGLQFARGEFIARMDADDIAHPERIAKQVQYMRKHPQVIVCGTQAQVIDGDGKVTGTKTLPLTHADIYQQYGVIHPMIHPTVMIRRSLLPDPQRIYEMKWDVNDDYFTFFTLLQYGEFVNLPQLLLKYRIHGKNLSLINPKQKFFNSVRIRMEAIQRLGYRISPKALVTMIAQLVIVTLIPEKLIVPMYMFLRGMSVKSNSNNLGTSARIRPSFK